jgi:deoxyribonucleoside regulator
MDTEHLNFLAQVATWYYQEELSQSEIAERIGRSRSMVSRLLSEAREQGLVEIRIHFPLNRDTSLEKRLEQAYGLTQARVLAQAPDDYDLLLKRLGGLGALELQEHLHDGVCIGISWGTAVHAVVQAMSAMPLRDVHVVQIIGATDNDDPAINADVDGPELARLLAQKLDAAYRFLHAPLIVEDETVARSLREQKSIARTLAQAAQADVILMGIGSLDPAFSSLWRTGYLNKEDLGNLRDLGAVGDILAQPLDASGRPLDDPITRRIIGLKLESLRVTPTTIAVAGGLIKAPAILAALRGGYVNILITDAAVATSVLQSHEEQPDAIRTVTG